MRTSTPLRRCWQHSSISTPRHTARGPADRRNKKKMPMVAPLSNPRFRIADFGLRIHSANRQSRAAGSRVGWAPATTKRLRWWAVSTLMLLALARGAVATDSSNTNTYINQFLGADRFYNAGYTGTRAI